MTLVRLTPWHIFEFVCRTSAPRCLATSVPPHTTDAQCGCQWRGVCGVGAGGGDGGGALVEGGDLGLFDTQADVHEKQVLHHREKNRRPEMRGLLTDLRTGTSRGASE